MSDQGGPLAPGPPPAAPVPDGTRGRVFGGASLVAVYLRDAEADAVSLAGTCGATAARYGLADRYPLAAHSPLTECCRTGRSLWRTAAALTPDQAERPPAPGPGGTPAPPSWEESALGVLPLGDDARGDDPRPRGCLVVIDEQRPGFDQDQRGLLELYADHVTERIEAGERESAPAADDLTDERPHPERAAPHPSPSGRAPGPQEGAEPGSTSGSDVGQGLAADATRLGTFNLELSTGRVDVDASGLELMGLAPERFDGRAETLVAAILPEDLATLMSVVESPPPGSGGRELEFRARRPSGELRWLHLRCRVRTDADQQPERVLGLLTDASRLRTSTDVVSRVQRLSTRLAVASTVREVTRVVVTALRELGADRVALAQPKSDRLVVTALDPEEPSAWPESWHADWPTAPVGALPALEESLLQGHTSVWPAAGDLEPALADLGRGGLAVLPLPGDGQSARACLAGWDAPHGFGAEERFLLTATAGLVGQAMVSAREVDARHELVSMVQRSLLPRTLPTLPGGVAAARYLPATVELDVGGDWYDVIPLTDRHVALVIGDVQGHSAGAATIMGQIRTAIRAYAVEGHPPDVVVSHANRLLLGMETDLFATCCYVAMDIEEGDTWLVRAGHLPPLVRDPDGGTRELEVEGGPPLGVVADAEFPMTTVGLVPGSVLALLTDGLVESAKLSMEDGLAHVRRILADTDPSDVGRLADALLGDANRRDDDVALLLLRYDGMKIKPRRASWTLWRLPDAVGHARRFTARTLRSWQATEGLDPALLVVSELVTNALVHTQGQVRLDLRLAGGRLRIAVSDSSPRTPTRPTSVDWEATGGRGILLVEAVATAWGSVPLSGGKQVWAEITLSAEEPGGATVPVETGGLQAPLA